MKIAISGKGGVGKTTVTTLWGRMFAADGRDVFLIDADPDANLAAALGIAPRDLPTPLIALKDLVKERTGADPDKVGQYFKLNPHVSDLPDTYAVKAANLRLLVLGGLREGGAGCACPQGAFLKAMMRHLMLERQEVLLVDLAAGLEFLGRAAVMGIDALVLVVEPGKRSLDTAAIAAAMGRDIGIRRFGAVLNKVTDPAQVEIIRSGLPKGVELLGHVMYSPALQQADLEGRAVFGVDPAAEKALAEAKQNLERLVAAGPAPSAGTRPAKK
jgi:CO dehydrogenase maturation factor